MPQRAGGGAHVGQAAGRLAGHDARKEQRPFVARLFEERAHLPAPAARAEAERATYDPTYGGYFLGKVAMLKLRADVQAARGASFDLRAFHEQVMRQGIAPLWAHRQLMLPGDTAPVLH